LLELPPLLLGPAELLGSGGKVEEVHRNDRGPRPKVGVADERIELAPRLYEAGPDLVQSFALLGREPVSLVAQDELLFV
jgi:hypothetical protein